VAHKITHIISLLGIFVCFVVVSSGFDSVFSLLAKRSSGKSVSKMTYFVSSGTLNLNFIRGKSGPHH